MSLSMKPISQKEFRVLAATTLGYYLVRDVVKRKWPRRVAQTAVVVAGVSVILPAQWNDLSKKERKQIREGVEEAKAQVMENLGTDAIPGSLVLVAAPAAAIGAGAWINGRLDAAGASVVTNTVGRLPLVGGLFRALPYTTYGAAQLGVLYLVNERVLRAA